MLRLNLFGIFIIIIWLIILLNACQLKIGNTGVINTGSSRADVLAMIGKPKRVQEFKLQETPFYGPQENLTNLIPARTLVEEWVYIKGEEELYVWFAGEEGQEKDQWRVIETARYPAGAVY
jgi:hypothetical protein